MLWETAQVQTMSCKEAFDYSMQYEWHMPVHHMYTLTLGLDKMPQSSTAGLDSKKQNLLHQTSSRPLTSSDTGLAFRVSRQEYLETAIELEPVDDVSANTTTNGIRGFQQPERHACAVKVTSTAEACQASSNDDDLRSFTTVVEAFLFLCCVADVCAVVRAAVSASHAH